MYTDDSEMIARNTTVSVGRIPLERNEKKIWREDRIIKGDLPQETDSITLLTGIGVPGLTGQADPQAQNATSGANSEEERLQQVVDLSGNEYSASNWERIR